MPVLAGFVNPIGRVPAFLVPLFSEATRNNYLLVQRMTASGVVEGFEPFDVSRGFEPCTAQGSGVVASIGEAGIWAFSFGRNDLSLGTAEQVRSVLEGRLRSGELSRLPLLESEVAVFCGADDVREGALRRAYEGLGGPTNVGASVWRDVVVLRPTICLDLSNIAWERQVKSTTSQLDAVALAEEGGHVVVQLPRAWHEELGHPSPERLPRAKALARVFGLTLRVVAVSPQAVPQRAVLAPARSALRYPVAKFYPRRAMTGFATMQRMPGPHSTPVGPYGALSHRSRPVNEGLWSGCFVSFNNRAEELASAKRLAAWLSSGEADVGMVVQRLGFGSPTSSTVRIGDLLDHTTSVKSQPGLRQLFYVGGHVLRRPLGGFSDLTTAKKGEALVVSAVSAVMALAYATGARSAGELMPMSRSGSIGLALRYSLKRDELLLDGFRALLALLLHPEARLSRSPRVHLVLPPQLWGSAKEVAEEATRAVGIAPEALNLVKLPTRIGRPSISLVAPEVPFERTTEVSFRGFVANLLPAMGWRTTHMRLGEEPPGILAGSDGATVFIVPIASPQGVEEAARVALGPDGRGAAVRCVVTNFTPDTKARRMAQVSGFSIVHYSRIEEWFASMGRKPK